LQNGLQNAGNRKLQSQPHFAPFSQCHGACRQDTAAHCLRLDRSAFAQDDADAASKQWRSVADQLRPRVPKLAALMDDAEADVLAFTTFAKEHRAKIHSANPLERHGEIKRRTDVIGIERNVSSSSFSSSSIASGRALLFLGPRIEFGRRHHFVSPHWCHPKPIGVRSIAMLLAVAFSLSAVKARSFFAWIDCSMQLRRFWKSLLSKMAGSDTRNSSTRSCTALSRMGARLPGSESATGRCGNAKLLTYTRSEGSGRDCAASSIGVFTDCCMRAPLEPITKILNSR
jgi:hypothetical protein